MLINFQYSVAQLSPSLSVTVIISSGAVPGKAGKAAALPRFCKIESGGGSGGGAAVLVVLPGPCARAAPAAPLYRCCRWSPLVH